MKLRIIVVIHLYYLLDAVINDGDSVSLVVLFTKKIYICCSDILSL